jgi:hypothetical protein
MICNQVGCDRTATHKVHWPGSSPVDVCEAHTYSAEVMARGLKLNVKIEEIYDPTRKGQSSIQNSKGEVY